MTVPHSHQTMIQSLRTKIIGLQSEIQRIDQHRTDQIREFLGETRDLRYAYTRLRACLLDAQRHWEHRNDIPHAGWRHALLETAEFGRTANEEVGDE